jgi:predicted RNA-binding Zn-ribbon protein involved in translation (DUF1610 family)
MERHTNCTRCGTILYGDREPFAGVCGTCSRPPLRRRRRLRRKLRTYVCRQCGTAGVQTVMGRPREFCESCSPRRQAVASLRARYAK